MPGFKVRHLVEKRGKDGTPRFYWQPAAPLRLRQSKTKRWVILPVYLMPHLVERLRGEAARGLAVVSTERRLLNGGRDQRAEIRQGVAVEQPMVAET